MKALLITVKGRVQGVAFRHYTAVKATQLGLSGYVKNLCDGHSVEIYAQGDEAALQELLQWSYQGPSHAYVEDVNFQWSEAVDGYNGFHVRY